MADRESDPLYVDDDGQLMFFAEAAFYTRTVWPSRLANRTDRLWQELRVQRWERQGGLCGCGCGHRLRRDQGDLHHPHYETYGRETVDDVVLMLRKCHARESRRQESLAVKVFRRAGFQCEMVTFNDEACRGSLIVLHRHHDSLGHEIPDDLLAACQGHAAAWLQERREWEDDLAVHRMLRHLVADCSDDAEPLNDPGPA